MLHIFHEQIKNYIYVVSVVCFEPAGIQFSLIQLELFYSNFKIGKKRLGKQTFSIGHGLVYFRDIQRIYCYFVHIL